MKKTQITLTGAGFLLNFLLNLSAVISETLIIVERSGITI